MGAVDLLGVEPPVALSRLLGGKQIVLTVVLPHRYPQPGVSPELHGRPRHPLLPLGRLPGAAEITGIGKLLPDLLKITLPLGQRQVLQYAVQIGKVVFPLFYL